SAAQLAQAAGRAAAHGNVRFVEAGATGTGPLPGGVDRVHCRVPLAQLLSLVYCRFLLPPLPDPERALGEMRALLRPGGVLVCEDGDLTTAGSEPPSALGAFADLFGRLGPARGVDYTLGSRLFQMVQDAGFSHPEVTFNQPA